jgi:hypothetical protein
VRDWLDVVRQVDSAGVSRLAESEEDGARRSEAEGRAQVSVGLSSVPKRAKTDCRRVFCDDLSSLKSNERRRSGEVSSGLLTQGPGARASGAERRRTLVSTAMDLGVGITTSPGGDMGAGVRR